MKPLVKPEKPFFIAFGINSQSIIAENKMYMAGFYLRDHIDLEAAVGPRTKAVVVLHYGGFPCDMEAVHEIAERRGLKVIEDAAHAPGGTWQGKKCGGLGLAGCFSFFSNKNLPIGEGGMITTDDDELAIVLECAEAGK